MDGSRTRSSSRSNASCLPEQIQGSRRGAAAFRNRTAGGVLATSEQALSILVVDDEDLIREALQICFEDGPHRLTAVATADQATSAVAQDLYDLALVDLRLGSDSGLDLIPRLREGSPWVKVVLMTAHGSIDSAIAATRLGVYEYMQKPFPTNAVRQLVDRVANQLVLERSVRSNGDGESGGYLPLLDSDSRAMRAALALADTVARSEASVLLRGESGTGKGVLARAIHRSSRRSRRRFGVVNCPSLSEELLNSELFGHVRGAFTGAVQNNQGMIAFTEGGTLFLDEIGEIPISLQPKLLRFLQDREYQRVGDPKTYAADVRIVAATNAPLERAVEQGAFRDDLYYRLNVFPIDIPPLRDRREDIPKLAHLFVSSAASRHDKNIGGISDEAMNRLVDHAWPGNVRELQNMIERAVIIARGDRLTPNDMQSLNGRRGIPEIGVEDGRLPTLEDMEKRYIRYVLDHANSIERAAEILDISPPTLWRRRRKYGL
jgi:NtrC-family two-component system response regulator AlgB